MVSTGDYLFDPRAEQWFDVPALAEACRAHRVALVLLFGSQAAEFTHTESDLDLAVWPHTRAGKTDFQLSCELSRIVDSACTFDPDRIDLLVIPTENSTLLMEVLRHHVVAYARSEDNYFDFVLKAIHDYEDDGLARRLSEELVVGWCRAGKFS